MVIARNAGRMEWVSTATGGSQGKRLGEMNDEEWEAVISVLENQKNWEELWNLVQKGIPKWSFHILHRLTHSGWSPKNDDRYKKLISMSDRIIGETGQISSQLNYQTIFRGHADGINCLAISPDSNILASGGKDSKICLWHLPNGELIKVLEGHNDSVNTLTVSQDGTTLTSIGNDKTIRTWHLPDGKVINILNGYNDSIGVISSDGKILASSSNGKRIRLWNLPKFVLLKAIGGQNNFTFALTISSDSSILASSSDDKTIRLWSLPGGGLIKVLSEHNSSIKVLTISLDNKILAGSGDDGSIRLWSLPDGRMIKTFDGHNSDVRALTISPDGKILASVGDDKAIRLWSLPEGELIKALDGHKGNVNALIISPNSNILAGGDDDKTICLWNMPDGKLLKMLGGVVKVLTKRNLGSKPSTKVTVPGDLSLGWTRKKFENLSSANVTVPNVTVPNVTVPSAPYNEIHQWNSESKLSTPITQTTIDDIVEIEEILKIIDLEKNDRNWLEFILELMFLYHQYDIVLDDSVHKIKAGKFDIIIDG
jgi:WD40 repeat protein